MDSKIAIVEIIAKSIQDYVSQEEKSFRQIEYYSGVSFHYVFRLSKTIIPFNKIDPVKLFHVLKVVKNISYAYEIIETNEVWEEKIRRVTGFDKEIGLNAVENKDFEKIIMASEENITVFLLACNHCGTTAKQLVKTGGEPLLNAARFLKKEGILEIKKTGIIKDSSDRPRDGWFYSFSRDSWKKIITALNSIYDPKRKPPIPSYMYAGTESCSKEFIDKLEKKMIEIRKWVDIEKIKPENRGDYPVFFTMTKDVFHDE